MQPRVRQLPILVFASSLSWGFLLNGFFLYLPSFAETSGQDLIALVSSLGWGFFGAAVYFTGRHYISSISSTRNRSISLSIGLSLLLAALVAEYVFSSSPAAWLFISAPFGMVLLAILNRGVLKSESSRVFAASAWLGAAPLIGLTTVAFLLSNQFVQENYLLLTWIVCSLALLVDRLLPAPKLEQVAEVTKVNLIPKNLILFGLSVGMAVSLANSFVYFRTAEVISAGSNLASQTSFLILLASVIGIVASLASTFRKVQSIQVLKLALVGGAAVLVAVSLAIVPGGYELLIAVAVFLGLGFGLINGLELRLVRQVGGSTKEVLDLNTRFLLVTTLPYLLAPSLGQLLYGITSTTTLVFATSAVFALASILLLLRRK